MNRRVIVCSKVKRLRREAEAKASVNSAFKLCAIDPNASDLVMGRLKRM
jgi:hypothetical protein